MGHYSFEGDQIQALRSARGREISVTLDTVSRFSTITLTVFVPDMELGDSSELSFHTIGIQATRRRSIAGSLGVEMGSEPLEFDGLASAARFLRHDPPSSCSASTQRTSAVIRMLGAWIVRMNG